MRFLLLLILAAVGANAFSFLLPQIDKRGYAQPGCSTSNLCNTAIPVSDAQAEIPSTPTRATNASVARSNCGTTACPTFNPEDQYVPTTGQYAYQSPGPRDMRGPCPGLNAAANHGYLPRSGVVSFNQSVIGLGYAYAMGSDLASLLTAYAIAVTGDLVTMEWSIGGPLPYDPQSGGTGSPPGISYSHNLFEGDTSITRCDAYSNGGDAHSLSPERFTTTYAAGLETTQFTLDKFAQLSAMNTVRSIQSNPYYFTGLFSTTVVAPAKYNFAINFMSNHSSDVPGGYLDGDILKSFFAVTGAYPNFEWQPGQEKIPDNWYRRPSNNSYTIPDALADLVVNFVAYPATFRFGGNTNGVSSYKGIDIGSFTNGVYNSSTLFRHDNFACFVLQAEQLLLPNQLQGGANNATAAFNFINSYLQPLGKHLRCPTLSQVNTGVFVQYSGSTYSPSPPQSGAINC